MFFYYSQNSFLPTSRPNLALWYDAADTSTITSSGGLVSQWNDKSGNAYHATKGTGSAQPTTNASTQNGRNILDFDGGDYFALPSGIYTLPGSNNTVFAVAKTSLDTTRQRLVSVSSANGTRIVLEYNVTSATINYESNPSGNTTILAGVTKSNFNILCGRRNGTTQAISFNNGAETTNVGGADGTGNVANIGALNNGAFNILTGSIAEIIAYNRALSASEIIQVNRYLGAKWGVVLS